MTGPRSHGCTLQDESAARRQGGAAWPRRFLAGAAIVAVLGVAAAPRNDVRTLGHAPGVLAERGQPLSRIAPEPAPGVPVSAGFACNARAHLSQPVGLVVLAAADPEKDRKLEDWREEGIRMAAELTGIPEAFFRWLQDKGVPVGEFMRFLMPFLEWIEMVDPHNGTRPSSQPRHQEKPRQTDV